jgi:branched-subunit amino acid ABC-type transport system permease component
VASSVLVLVIGGLASELGVAVATLLMGLVVAALVASDELRRDLWRAPDAAMP